MITTRPKKLVVAALVMAAGALAFGGYLYYAPRRVPEGQPALVHLDTAQIATLRDAFNSGAGGTRLLVLLSPT
jgi:hypothetical protein